MIRYRFGGRSSPGAGAPRRAVLLVLLLAAGALPRAAAGLEAAAAKALIQRTTEDIVVAFSRGGEALRRDPARANALLERIVAPHVDLERTARWVLGRRRWRDASPGQRRRFVGAFRILLMDTYATAITRFTEGVADAVERGVRVTDYLDETITYLPLRASRSGNEVTVETRVALPRGAPITIKYRVHASDARWKVFDIAIAGISLVVTYRAEFRALLRDVGLEGLIRRLEAKNRRRDTVAAAGRIERDVAEARPAAAPSGGETAVR